MSIYRWYSDNELVVGDSSYFVARYDESIRRQSALVLRTGSSQRVVAYFKDEDDAKAFAKALFGGVRS